MSTFYFFFLKGNFLIWLKILDKTQYWNWWTPIIQSCRGLEPANSRLWGKGVSITQARMDQFIYNLGLELWLYRHYMDPPEVCIEMETWDICQCVRRAWCSQPGVSRTANQRPSGEKGLWTAWRESFWPDTWQSEEMRGRKGRRKGRRAVWSIVGVTNL